MMLTASRAGTEASSACAHIRSPEQQQQFSRRSPSTLLKALQPCPRSPQSATAPAQAPSQRPMLRCAAAGALPTAAAAAAADGPRPHAQAEAAAVDGAGGSGSGDVSARVAHVYRIEGLGTLTLEGALPGAPSQAAGDAAVLAVLAEFHTRRAQLLSRTVKHVVKTFPQDLPVPLVQQMKTQELARGEVAAVMGLCDISTLRILARRLAPDAAAAEADRWRPGSPEAVSAATPQRATGKAAAGPKPTAGAAAAIGARPGAPFPEQYVPPPPSGDPNQPPGDPAQPPAPLLGELNPPKVLESVIVLRDSVLDWAVAADVIKKGFTDPAQHGIEHTWQISSALHSGPRFQHRVAVRVEGPGVGHLWQQVADKPSRAARAAAAELTASHFKGRRYNPFRKIGDERSAAQDLHNAAVQLLKLAGPPLSFSFCLSVDTGLHRGADREWKPGAGAPAAQPSMRAAENSAAAFARTDHCAQAAAVELCGSSQDLEVLARAALHVLTYTGRDADAWAPRDTALQLRCRAPDRRQHPLYAANGPSSAYQLRSTAADGSQTTIELSGRQLLALADVLDMVMAQHPGWVRPGLRAPPPPAVPDSRRAGLLRTAGRAATAPIRLLGSLAAAPSRLLGGVAQR